MRPPPTPRPPPPQVRSRLTVDGPTVRRSSPGAMSWYDTTICTRGTSPSCSCPSECPCSPSPRLKRQHQGSVTVAAALWGKTRISPEPRETRPKGGRNPGNCIGAFRMLTCTLVYQISWSQAWWLSWCGPPPPPTPPFMLHLNSPASSLCSRRLQLQKRATLLI